MDSSTVAASKRRSAGRRGFFRGALAAFLDFRVVGIALVLKGKQEIHEAFLGDGGGFFAEGLGLLGLHHTDGDFQQVADHGFDIAADIADLGVLGGFHLDEGAPVREARRRAISVLPTPVGPIMRMFLG